MRPRAAQLHQRKFYQPDVDHVASHATDLDPVAGLDSEASNQKEVAGDRQDHVLQRDRDSGGGESNHGGGRSELVGEIHHHDDHDQQAEHQPPRRHHLPAAPDVGHVAVGQPSPHHRAEKNDQQRSAEHDQADQEAAEFFGPSLRDRVAPAADVVGVNPQQHDLLAER